MKKSDLISIVTGVAGSYLFAAAIFLAGCGGDLDGEGTDAVAPDDSGHGHAHEAGAHGGEIMGLANGEVHVEFVLDESKERVDLYLLGADGKTALESAVAPSINIRVGGVPKQIATAPAGGVSPASHFTATDPAFADHHLDGQLVISAGGKQYFANLVPHEHEDEHVHAENAISFTEWTDKCEWFVELETPEVGHAVEFAAHVTLLESFQAVTAGTFRVEASAGGETASTSADSPVRPGIYTPSISFPTAGTWKLSLTFDGHGITDTVEWTVTVHEAGKVPDPAEDPAGVISFLKEQQWKIPFATVMVPEAADGLLTVPASSVLDDAGAKVVVVQLGGESFALRVVEIVALSGEVVQLTAGPVAGQRVVTRGGAAVVGAK